MKINWKKWWDVYCYLIFVWVFGFQAFLELWETVFHTHKFFGSELNTSLLLTILMYRIYALEKEKYERKT